MSPHNIDPRITAAGGRPARPNRDDTAGGYTYPGMMSATNWAMTSVARATRFYGCAFCGTRFKGPHAVYTHQALRHHPTKATPGTGTGVRTAREAAPALEDRETVKEAI